MSTESGNSVIHKKARHGREDFDARAMSPSKALRLSLERCGDRLFDLALTVCAVEQRKLAHASLKDEADGDRLIVLLDGEAGARGAVLFDRPFVQALVEVQTMGRVTSAVVPERPFTSTDAAVAAPLVDAILAGFDEKLSDAAEQRQPLGFRFGDRVEDVRGLMLALEVPEYQLFRVTVDIGFGSKTGELVLILPAPVLARADASAPASGEGAAFNLADLAMTAPVVLDAVLERIQLPLAQVCALKPGMTLPVSTTAIGRTELVAAHGHVVARVRLGQVNGFRAARLLTGEDGSHAVNDPASSVGFDVPSAGANRLERTPIDLAGAPAVEELSDQPLNGIDSAGPNAALAHATPSEKSASDLSDLSDGLPDLPGLTDDGAGGLPDLPQLSDLSSLQATGQ